jgi:hypothetical protein
MNSVHSGVAQLSEEPPPVTDFATPPHLLTSTGPSRKPLTSSKFNEGGKK